VARGLRTLLAVAALCLLLSVSALAAPEKVIACARAEWVWTDKKEYKPGEEVKIFLQNAGDQVIDGRMHLTILKYENRSWVLVLKQDGPVRAPLLEALHDRQPDMD
jgi:hypothetical protein